MMSSKDKQDSRRSKVYSELKNPGRREVLGVAVVAAAFTAGQVGSAEGQGLKFGGPADQVKLPDRAGYNPVSKFHDLNPNQKVYKQAQEYRAKVSEYAKGLRQAMGLESEFMHVIRLEPKAGNVCNPAEGCCGCCCC
jgi:hypothetical protein